MYECSYAAFDIAAFLQDVGMVNLPMANLLIYIFVVLEGRADVADLLCSEICR